MRFLREINMRLPLDGREPFVLTEKVKIAFVAYAMPCQVPYTIK